MEARPEVHVKLFDKLVNNIKSKPEGELVVEGLSANDLKRVMDDLLKSSAAIPGLTINSNLDVQIKDAKAVISGNIGIDHSLVGHSSANINLEIGNGVQKNTIETKKMDIDIELSTRAQMALSVKGINLDSELNKRLKRPQDSLLELFKGQLKEKGLNLEGFAANFSPKQDILLLGFRCKNV